MGSGELDRAADGAYCDRIQGYTLSELEDVYAHLDRVIYPNRFKMVKEVLEGRLRALGEGGAVPSEERQNPGGLLRRLWAGLLDLFVHLLILGFLYVVFQGVVGLAEIFGGDGAGRPGPGRRPGPSAFASFLRGLVQGEPTAWWDLVNWAKLGVVGFGFLAFRGVLTVPIWVRSGRTIGMREAGIRLVSEGGRRPSVGRALVRFSAQYFLFLATGGLSGLWMVWDSEGRALHDKLARTRIVRALRSWESPAEVRLFD